MLLFYFFLSLLAIACVCSASHKMNVICVDEENVCTLLCLLLISYSNGIIRNDQQPYPSQATHSIHRHIYINIYISSIIVRDGKTTSKMIGNAIVNDRESKIVTRE